MEHEENDHNIDIRSLCTRRRRAQISHSIKLASIQTMRSGGTSAVESCSSRQ